MNNHINNLSDTQNNTSSGGFWKKTLQFTFLGGVAFWLANFAISRTPIAAEYRTAMSISYYPMLLESLMGGVIIGFGFSYLYLRFYNRLPSKDPITKSIILSMFLLVFVTILIGSPASFSATSNTLRYFMIGTTFNLIRIVALGIAIGYIHKRKLKQINPSTVAEKPARME